MKKFSVLFTILVSLWFFASAIHIGVAEDDGQKLLAKEYNVPMSLIPYVYTESNFLLIPHYTFYVTTDRGEDITLATSYFGIVFFDNDNIDKYLGLNSIKEELKSRGYYEWAE